MKYLFVIDVDGVLTDGKFYYSSAGKIVKAFGPDDHDALKLVADHFEVIVVTADKLGYEISRKRVEDDMNLPLYSVSVVDRGNWITEKYPKYFKIYMGDGIFDPQVFKRVDYSVAPANASKATQDAADFVTTHSGGDRAVAEACIHLMKKYFGIDIYNNGE